MLLGFAFHDIARFETVEIIILTYLMFLLFFQLQYDLLYTVGALDFEQTPTLTIRVKVTDSGTPPLSREQNFVIKVINVNEKPTQVHISNSQIDENSPSNTLVGKLSTSDPDNTPANVRQTFTYTLLDTGSGRFKMDVDQIKVNYINWHHLMSVYISLNSFGL